MSDTTEAEATDPAAQVEPGTTEDAAVVDDSGDADEGAQDENNGRRGVRQRLADTELERDGLRDNLTRQRQAVFAAALEGTGVDADLMAARQHTAESFVTEDGLLDTAAITAAAADVAAHYKLAPARRPTPDPLVGTAGSGGEKATTWGETFKSALAPG
jgi:hypothetical protein